MSQPSSQQVLYNGETFTEPVWSLSESEGTARPEQWMRLFLWSQASQPANRPDWPLKKWHDGHGLVSDGRRELQLKRALEKSKLRHVRNEWRYLPHLLQGGIVSIPADDRQPHIAGQLQEVLAGHSLPADKHGFYILDVISSAFWY